MEPQNVMERLNADDRNGPAHSPLDAVPPTRRDGESLRQWKNRFERYLEPPFRNLGEDYAAYCVRRDRHVRRAREQWWAALTPADEALIYEEMVANQIEEDAQEEAWQLERDGRLNLGGQAER